MRTSSEAASATAALPAIVLMLASGFAGLGYQIVWTQQSALWLGHESVAVLAVVTAFFGGLGVGAILLGRRVADSARPARWYAGCEGLIALWSLVLAAGMAPIGDAVLALIGAAPSPAWQWTVAFAASFLLFLPATAAMGATLPAIERALAWHGHRGRANAGAGHAPRQVPIGALYAANTFGAVVGVLACAFWLLPSHGLQRTAQVCAALNLLCAVVALWRFDGPGRPEGHAAADAAWSLAVVGHIPALASASRAAPGLLATMAATGLLGIGYEVVVVRVLSQVAENTVYTFALLLAVYLFGSAAGAAWYDRRAGKARAAASATAGAAELARQTGQRLLSMLSLACLAGAASLWGAESLKARSLALLGPGMPAALAAEALLATVAFLPPTLLMGALFSHLATRARDAGIGLHWSLGVNTLGAAAAPVLFGLLALPALGAKAVLIAVAAFYLLLARPVGPRRTMRLPLAIGAALAGLAWLAPPLAFVDVPDGGHVVSYRDGVMASVSVVEEADGTRRLRINNRQQEGSNAAWSADARQALLPLLLHPAPRTALFLGLGTGVTASAATVDPMLRVEAVELLPEVVEAATSFGTGRAEAGQRLQVRTADARRFVRASSAHYDLIVSDNFHPARSGSAALYTVEHFQAVRARLARDGLFCQWLPLHQLDLRTLASIVRAFTEAFPDAGALLATNSLDTPVLGLVGRADGLPFSLAGVRQRVRQAHGWPTDPAALGLVDEYAVLGALVAGPKGLWQLAGDAPANTDDRPVVAYLAPRAAYAPEAAPRERLLALMAVLSADATGPSDMAALIDAEPAEANRLAAYGAARARFLTAGSQVWPSADVRRMLAQVEQPLLDVLRTSPDFRPAYDPLLQMAMALGRVDAAAAKRLLAELNRLQPLRTEAGEALRQLAAGPSASR